MSLVHGAPAPVASAPTRSGWIGAAAIAAICAVALVVADIPTADAPAHLYRTLLVRDGIPFWDNLWYAGHYPLASYSLLYYLPAALVGNLPLVFAATTIAAALFASVVHAEWPSVGPWPARIFAVLAAGPLFTGTYTYALGLAALLGSVRALQSGRTWAAAGCAALTLGFNPLAFVLLCLVLGAVLLTHRADRRTVLMAGALVALVTVELTALWLFPYHGVYPFSGVALLGAAVVGGFGLAVSARARGAGPLTAFFVLWLAASGADYLVTSPIGANLVRIQLLIFPLMLLAALLADLRPRLLVACALAAAFAYNTVPYAVMASQRVESSYRNRAAWAPVLSFLHRFRTPNYRVEVVPTAEHWEAYYLPAAGVPLARGWYRQLDLAQNPLLYRQRIAPAAYRHWLRRLGIRYVLLPARQLDALGARSEATLLRSGHSGLTRVFRSRLWTIYRLPGATPILSGPAGARLTRFGHDRISGWTARAGRYRLRVRYMPYWRVVAGDVCLAPAAGGSTTTLVSRHGGRFDLISDERPGQVLENVVSPTDARCRSGGRAAR